MASLTPREPPPRCQVQGCRNTAQPLAIKGDVFTYHRTCRQHTYMDLHLEKERNKRNK